MSKQRVVSGMQPNSGLHIGNYLGALKNWLDIQDGKNYSCFFFIADYHSISGDYDPQEKKDQIFNLACDYLAAGLDPEKSRIFIQSQVPKCTELAWIFNTITPMSELERMTQFKEKASQQIKNINMGLFNYPVLQAADILLYQGELVPVGEDQVQHVEITRNIARWFNNKYKTNIFPESKPLLTPSSRIMSLTDPTSKMSKSMGDKNFIGIDDEPEVIISKIKKAVTTPEGVENLKAIYEAFEDSMDGEFNEERMGDTKMIIGSGIAKHFESFRKKKQELVNNPDYVNKILEEGRAGVEKIASDTIDEIKTIIGVK
jgi:tryptophanyl-tRNA synthetase